MGSRSRKHSNPARELAQDTRGKIECFSIIVCAILAAANALYDFVDSVDSDMDGRWGSNADGSCTYDHERAAEYSALLRTVHPEFFAGRKVPTA